MRVKRLQQPFRMLILAVLCLGLLVEACHAGSVGVKALLADAGRYLGRRVEVEGNVDRVPEATAAGTPGSFLLTDGVGDGVLVRSSGVLPALGERVAVNGSLALDAGGRNYVLQCDAAVSLKTGADGKTAEPAGGGDDTPFYRGSGFKRKLAAVVAISAAMFLFIIGVSLKIKKSQKNASLDIPEYSFDEVSTLYMDSSGKFAPPTDGDPEEQTRLILPGYYEITSGSVDIEGQRFYLATAVTRIGREETGIDKVSGWISFPAHMATISRHQADLVYKDGGYCIENRSKTNSTLVNGIPLAPDQSVKIGDLDIISFGGVELTYMGPK